MSTNNLLFDAFFVGDTLRDIGGRDTTGLDTFVDGELYPGIMGPSGPADVSIQESGIFMQATTVAALRSVQHETALYMQSATYAIMNVQATFEIGIMAAHSVTVAGHSVPQIDEFAVYMQSSTRKFIPTSMVPGTMTMLGVGL